jgi:hypothetical protein
LCEGNYRDYPYDTIEDLYRPNCPGRKFDILSFEVLKNVGLIRKISIDELPVGDNYLLDLEAYQITEFGIRFFEAVATKKLIAAAQVQSRKRKRSA